jgi:hypothetical protein
MLSPRPPGETGPAVEAGRTPTNRAPGSSLNRRRVGACCCDMRTGPASWPTRGDPAETTWPASATAVASAQSGLAARVGGRMQDRPRGAPALVGRDGELGELLAGLDDAVSGSGRLFLLTGDPGIGKKPLGLRGGGAGPGSWVQGCVGAVLGDRRGAGLLAVGAVAAGLHPRRWRRGTPGAAGGG